MDIDTVKSINEYLSRTYNDLDDAQMAHLALIILALQDHIKEIIKFIDKHLENLNGSKDKNISNAIQDDIIQTMVKINGKIQSVSLLWVVRPIPWFIHKCMYVSTKINNLVVHMSNTTDRLMIIRSLSSF